MESTFSKPLSRDSVTYIVISDNCCHSCFDATKNLLDNKNCIFILGKKNAQKCSIANGSKINVLVDNSNNVNQIKYTKDNIAFIKTYKGLIYSIDAPEPLQIIKYIENTSHN